VSSESMQECAIRLNRLISAARSFEPRTKVIPGIRGTTHERKNLFISWQPVEVIVMLSGKGSYPLSGRQDVGC